jgi:hypothetical protein
MLTGMWRGAYIRAPFPTSARPSVIRSRRSALLFAGILGLSLLSCGREVTGPNDGLGYGRTRIAALAVAPEFPRIPGANAISDLVPFERVRITLRRLDGTTAKDTLVDFPSTADSISLAIDVPLPITAPDSGLTLALSLAYINAAGDTVFRGGPLAFTARPGSDRSSAPIAIPVSWVPPGGVVPASVVLSPATGTAVAGTTTTFTAVARDGQGQPIDGTPIFFSSEDTLRARVANVGSGVVSWLPVRGTARIIATLPNGPADTSSFDVSLPAALLLLVAGDAQSATINTALAQPLSFRVVASDSVPVAGQPVTFTVTAGGGTLGAIADTSDATGLVTTSWTLGALVGAQSVTATVTGVPTATRVVTATGSAPVPTQLAITAAPTTAVAGATFTPVTVEVRDADGARTPLFAGPVSIALDPATAAGATLAGTTTVNAVAGIATFADLRVERASAGLTLITTSAGLTPDTSAALSITTGAATQLVSVSGGGQSGAVLTALTAPFVVRVTDAFGNPVAGTTVNWAVTAGVGSLSAASTTTDAAGEASTILTLGGTIGSVTVAATATGLTGSPVSFGASVLSGAPTQLFFSQSSTSATAGDANEWIVQVRDAAGNISTGFNGPVSVALIDGPPTAVLGGTTTVNAVAGVASFNTLTVDLAATTYRLVASSAGLPDVPSVPFTITAAAASALVLVSGDAQTAVISTTLSQPFLVRVTDVFTNPVAGVTVAWAITSGGGTLSAPSAVTDALGNASVTLTTGLVAGASTVTATVAGLTGSPVTFASTVTAGAAASLAITSGPIGPQVAGVPLANVVVEARDAGDNLVSSFTGQVIARAEQGGIAVDSAQAVAVAGVATFIGAFFETAGTYSIRFSATGLADAQSDTFVVSPAAATQLALQTGDAQSGTVGQLLPAPLVVRATDAFDNGVGGVTVRWAVVRGGDTLAALDVATDATGSAAYQPTLPDSAGPLQFVARATGLAGSPLIATATVNPGAATQLAIITAPTSGVVSTALPTSTIHVLDALGNLVTTFTGAVGAQVDSGPVGGTLAGNTPIAAVAGVASFTNIGVAVVGTYRLRFTSAGLTDAVSANFDVTAGAPTQLVFVQQTAAGTAGAALAPGFTVEARDAGNNLVTTFTGAVTVGLGGGNPLALLGGTTSATAVAGVASFADLTVDLAATGYTLTASADALANATSAAFTIGAAAPATMTLIAGDAQTGPVSATLADSIAFRVTDAFGNAVPSAGWTIAVTGGGGSASPAGGNADAAGEFRTSWTLGAALGPQSINAFVTAQPTILATATATAVAGAPTQLVLTSAPFGTLTAGVAAPDLVLEARDAGGNLATGFTGTVWGRVNTGPVIGNDSVGVAAVGGIATFSGVVYDRAGSYTLRFNADGLTDAISPSFDVVPGAPAAIAPDTLAPGGGQTGIVGEPLAQPLRVLVTDAFGNGAGGVLVTFTAVRGADTLGTGTAVSDAAGLVSYTPTLPTSAGALAYLVTADGLTGSGFSLTATAAAGAPSQLAITQQPDTVVAASVIGGIVVQARDAFGNATSGFVDVISVQILTGPAGAALGGTTSLAADGGEATFSTLTLDLAGDYQLQFTSGTLAAAVPLLTVIPGAPSSLVAVAGAGQTGPINTELTDSLAVRVTDLGGNPIAGVATNWAVTAGGGALSTAVATTGADGLARVAWTLGPLAGAQQVDVEATGVGNATFTATGTTASLTWSGAESDAWTSALNWVEGRAPVASDSITVPSTGFTFSPRITASTFVRSLVNLSESPITVDGAIVLQVTERLNVRSDVIGVTCPTGSVDMGTVGGSAVLRGRVDCDLRGIASTVTLDGETYVGGGRGGSTQFDSRLIVNGQRLTIEGGFFTFNTSRLEMTNPADTVTLDNVSFQGGATAGSLTEGLLSVRGTLDAQATPGSFTASGNHRTRFISGIGDTVTVSADAGPVGFGAVEFARPVRLAGEFSTEGEAFVNYGGAVVGTTGRLAVGGSLVGTSGTLVAPRTIALAGVLADTGTFRPDTTIFTGTGQVMPFRVGASRIPEYQAVRITGAVTIAPSGSVDSLAGGLVVQGTAVIDDATTPSQLVVTGDLEVTGAGATMRSVGQPHQITVYGNARFDGADSDGLLADGAMAVFGDFTVDATHSARSFRPAPGYGVRLESDGVVRFADPVESRFGILEVFASGITREFRSDVNVAGNLRLAADGNATFASDALGAGGTRVLTTPALDQLGGHTFRNVALRLIGAGPVNTTTTMTFADFDPAAVQFDIARATGTIVLYDPIFSTAPTGAGRYLRVTDTNAADADDLTVSIDGVPTPQYHGGFAEAVAPAVLTGWGASASFTWTGAAGSSLWTNAANWSGGAVPTAADSVTVPATLIAPVIPAGTTLRAFVSTRTETPITTAGSFTITETLAVPTVAGLDCGINALEFSNGATSMNARGLVSCFTRVLDGTLAASDTLIVGGGNDLQVEGSAILEAGTDLVSVSGNLGLIGATALLRMLDDSAHVLVAGGATFSGAPSTGQLTAGLLEVRGNFTQNGDPASFAASGTHVTAFVGDVLQQVEFANPGQAGGTSHFAHLALGQTEGGVSVRINTDVYAIGQLRDDIGSVRTISAGTGGAFFSGGANVSGATFDGVRWEILDGAPVEGLTGITFANMPTEVPQFSVTRTSGVVPATNFTFTTPPSAGVYVRAEDPDAEANGSLVISMSGTSPAGHGGAIAEVNTATIIGWSETPPLVWDGSAGDGDWGNPLNWNLDRLPIATDSVLIETDGVVNLSAPATVAWLIAGTTTAQTLNLNAGAVLQVDSAAVLDVVNMTVGSTLTGDGSVTVTGALDWNGGTMSGGGGTLVISGATAALATDQTITLTDRTFLIGGTTALGGGGFVANGVPIISVSGGGTLDLVATTSYTSPAQLLNAGTVRKAAVAGTVRIDWPIVNTGTIEVEDEVLDLRGTLDHATGTIAVGSGATLVHGGQLNASAAITIAEGGSFTLQSGGTIPTAGFHHLQSASSVTGAGTLRLFGADTVIVAGAVNIDSLVVGSTTALFQADTVFVAHGGYVGGGFFSGSSTIAISGIFTMATGNPNGSGTIYVRLGGELRTTEAVFRGWDIDVAGTWNWADGNLGLTTDPDNVADSSFVNIRPTGVMSINHGDTGYNIFAQGVAIVNGGTFRKATGTATITTFGMQVLNNGIIDVLAGGLNIQSGCAAGGTGTVNVSGGATFSGVGCSP